MLDRKTKKALLIICFLLLALKVDFAAAIRVPEIQYPEIPFSDVKTPNEFIMDINASTTPAEDILGLYIRYFYSLILIIGVLAVFTSIVYGGFQYLLAVDKPGLSIIGKDRISSGILGLIILFSTQFILTAINPQFSVFNFTAPGIEKCDCAKPQNELSDYCKVYCQTTQPITDKPPMYIEIPLGRLNERVLKASEEAKQITIVVKRKAEILQNLSEELKNLTIGGTAVSIAGMPYNYNGCQCGGLNTQCGDECSGGVCIGDPCGSDRERIDELRNDKIPKAVDALDRWKEQAIIKEISLKNEKLKLEFAESLMRDSVFSPINYQSFIGLENKQVRKLSHWANVDIDISGLAGPGLTMENPIEGCGSASCVTCGETLFCYGNNDRTCETNTKFNSGKSLISASEFPDNIALYNGMDFPVPSNGVTVCNDNVFGCGNSACRLTKGPEDPATFYIPEKGNEELISIIEGLSLSVYHPPTRECAAGETKPYTSCDGKNCVTIDACGASTCSGDTCAAPPPPNECPVGQTRPYMACDNFVCRTIDACGASRCENDNGCGAPPNTDTYANFARIARGFADSPFLDRRYWPPIPHAFSFNHLTYINAEPRYLKTPARYYGADCGVYVSTVMKLTIDPGYPDIWTPAQENRLRNNPDFDCFRINSRNQLRPGDILFRGTGGHVAIWLDDGIWDASLEDYLPMGPYGWTADMNIVCRYRYF